MTDHGVKLVREWLQRQPFSLRILTLILFMVEAVKDEFGEETMKSFEGDLREAYRNYHRQKEKQSDATIQEGFRKGDDPKRTGYFLPAG